MSALPRDRYVDAAVAGPGKTSEVRPANLDSELPPRQLVEVLCECGRVGCAARIVLSVSEYEAVRRYPDRFLINEGHEVAETDRVVDNGAGYVVVAKNRRQPLHAVGLA
jgi:hypothetical protein